MSSFQEILDGLRSRFPSFVKDMEQVRHCHFEDTPYINRCYEILWGLVVKAEQEKQVLIEPTVYYEESIDSDSDIKLEWVIGKEKLVIACDSQEINLSLYDHCPEDTDATWAAKNLLVKKFFNWE